MSTPEHFWLFKPSSPVEIGDAEPVSNDVFTSLDDARLAALRLAGTSTYSRPRKQVEAGGS